MQIKIAKLFPYFINDTIWILGQKMIVFKKSQDSDAIFFDEHKTHLEQKKAFFTSAEEVFGYMLLLFRLNMGLNQEQMGAVLIYNKPMSKSGYSKIERAENSVNIQILFDLSFLTGINFSHILTIYNELVHTIANAKNDIVIFNEMCGHYGLGNNGGYVEFKKIGPIKETYKAKIKNYNDVVGESTLKLVNNTINKYLTPEMKEHIKFRADCIINSKKYPNKSNIIQTGLIDKEALKKLEEQYAAEPESVRKEYTFDKYAQLLRMGIDIHKRIFF
ncbi:hypothetical protein [Acinetobacter indicus]|uniref:hypothetical protein n=1 Tax=Acinetobacter indicus TaxID=756892 RepID=UPI0013633316|nr:hypothetical protein [Acinetobacter indicus]